ncbi:SpoU rRNA Methylase family [Musa troglodytarum]|uniref:Threonine dehydratase n=1 Tax=Musa troglodytarum TaxID=320322 RepID=A0A9E7K1V1_9LILI|nr:SpoU rRNA Methylase family [Musa troglodytarum]
MESQTIARRLLPPLPARATAAAAPRTAFSPQRFRPTSTGGGGARLPPLVASAVTTQREAGATYIVATPLARVSVDSLQYESGVLGAITERTRPAAGEERPNGALTPMEYLTNVLSSRVYDVAIESPLQLAPKLSERLGVNLWLKREDLQPVFSFKLRGAYNMMVKLSRKQLDKGVICSSAGNHAQGVALAAQKLHCDAVIVMPVTTPEIKWRSVERLGATVVLKGDSYDEAQTYAKQRAEQEGHTFIHPFDHPDVITGQGTIGMEIVRQLTGPLHAIFVPVGGGGLIAGIAAYVKRVCPEVKIIGVEPSDANAMALSLHHGQRIMLEHVGGFADGVAVKVVGEETFRLCRELVDGVVLVSRDSICASIKDMFEEKRSILEPAGALSLAGAEAYCKYYGLKGTNVVAITSGANMNFDRLRLVTELADVGRKREAVLATILPEERGSFKTFCKLVGSMNITEFKYRYDSRREDALVLYRQMGGRSNVQDELLCRFIFPERPGIQVPKEDMQEFKHRAQDLGYEYTYEMTDESYRLLMHRNVDAALALSIYVACALLFAEVTNPRSSSLPPFPETLIPCTIDHRSLPSPLFSLTHCILPFLCSGRLQATAVSGLGALRFPLPPKIADPRHSSAEGPESHRRRACGVEVQRSDRCYKPCVYLCRVYPTEVEAEEERMVAVMVMPAGARLRVHSGVSAVPSSAGSGRGGGRRGVPEIDGTDQDSSWSSSLSPPFLRWPARITSASNPFVKHCVKLRLSSSYRRSCGSALVVGLTPILSVSLAIQPVLHILMEICRFQQLKGDDDSMVDCLLLLDGADTLRGFHHFSAPVVHVSPIVMKKVSGMQSIDSIEAIALMRLPGTFLNLEENDEICQRWFPSSHRLLVLDGIQDPGNLGTLIRSAMAFKWDGAFLLPSCCDPFNEKALRASRGASFQLPVVSGTWSHLMTLKTKKKVKMLAGHPGSSADGSNTTRSLSHELAESLAGEPLCLVLGSEGHGLSKQTVQACELVSIPMAGGFESLNVSVAGGIFLFMLQPEACR